jgi:hypothetical protein
MQYCMPCKTNGGKQTIPKPILGIAIDFAGSRVQFNQRLAGARCSFRSGCCRARSTGNLQTFLLTCTVTGPLLANDQRSGLNRLFLPEPRTGFPTSGGCFHPQKFRLPPLMQNTVSLLLRTTTPAFAGDWVAYGSQLPARTRTVIFAGRAT